jgi:hypothetical protein
MLVREHNEGTRLCNADASLRNVLTMTGQPPDLSEPTFIYSRTTACCSQQQQRKECQRS